MLVSCCLRVVMNSRDLEKHKSYIKRNFEGEEKLSTIDYRNMTKKKSWNRKLKRNNFENISNYQFEVQTLNYDCGASD